jgi:hypothetical protein
MAVQRANPIWTAQADRRCRSAANEWQLPAAFEKLTWVTAKLGNERFGARRHISRYERAAAVA